MQCFWGLALTDLVVLALELSLYLFHDGLRPQASQTMRRLCSQECKLARVSGYNESLWQQLGL